MSLFILMQTDKMHKLTILMLAMIALSWVTAQDDEIENEWKNFKVATSRVLIR